MYYLPLLLLPLLILSNTVRAQKPPLDTSVYTHWPEISDYAISPDGAYVYYSVINQDRHVLYTCLVNTGSRRVKKLKTKGRCVFTRDSQTFLYRDTDDWVTACDLKSFVSLRLFKASSFQYIHQKSGEYLIAWLDDRKSDCIVRDLKTAKIYRLKDVVNFVLSGDQQEILITCSPTMQSRQTLHLFRFDRFESRQLFSARHIRSPVQSEDHRWIAWIGTTNVTATETIYIYDRRKQQMLLTWPADEGQLEGSRIASLIKFSEAGDRLFLELKRPGRSEKRSKITIWSYQDAKLKSNESGWEPSTSFIAVISLKSGKFIRLQQPDDQLMFGNDGLTDDYLFTSVCKGEYFDRYWNRALEIHSIMTSTKDGSRKEIPVFYGSLSPDKGFVVGYDRQMRDLYSYNIATGEMINLTQNIPAAISMPDIPIETNTKGLRYFCWTSDNAVIVYGSYDIWKINYTGSHHLCNLTQAKGSKEKIRFRLPAGMEGKVLGATQKLTVMATDSAKKHNGYYELDLLSGSLQRLFMGPYVFDDPDDGLLGGGEFVKAPDSAVFLVMRSSPRQSPNLYTTKDFRQFTLISDVFPEKKYRWMDCRLITINTTDGRQEQALLYTPENMDTSVKSPAIVYVYEKKSQEAHRFQKPGVPSGSDLDIGWFASHGYVIIVPDIHYRSGSIGPSSFLLSWVQ